MGSGSSSAAPKYGFKTTADMIAKEFGSNAKDLNIVITGANSGIGLESARVLSRSGAKVVLACRSKKNADEAILKIKEENPSADVTFMELDLTSLESIHSFADQYKASNRPLNVLLNNAGVMACPLSKTKDGFEMQLGVNYLGPFYLTCQLWDVLKRSGSASAPSRILNVSSDAQSCFTPQTREKAIDFSNLDSSKGYSSMRRYGESKLAVLIFIAELQRRCLAKGDPVISLALHPGVIQTNLQRHFTFSSIMELAGILLFSGKLTSIINEKPKNIPQGAATNVYCSIAPVNELKPGKYYANCLLENSNVHPFAYDENLGKKLWNVTLEMLKINDKDWI